MRFLRGVMEQGEHPICRTGLHPIYLVAGFMWFAALSAIGWIADYNLWVRFGAYIPAYEINNQYLHIAFAPGMIGWFFTACGAYILAGEFIKFISTSVVMTTKRLLYKRGLIKIKFDATDIGDILGVHIDQGWFGQFFGYGKVHLDCRFIEDVYIPYVKNPYGIMKALQKARAAHSPSPVFGQTEEAEVGPKQKRIVSQTLVQVTGPGPVYIVDKVPNDPKTPLAQLPKSVGDNMMNAFRRKA